MVYPRYLESYSKMFDVKMLVNTFNGRSGPRDTGEEKHHFPPERGHRKLAGNSCERTKTLNNKLHKSKISAVYHLNESGVNSTFRKHLR